MRVTLHMGTLRGAGSARLGRALLTSLAATRPPRIHHITAWTPPNWALPSGIDAHHVMRPGALAKLLTENLSMRRSLRRADALLSFGDTSLPACPIPHALLIQQAFLVHDLRALPFSLPPPWHLKLSLMQRYLRLCIPSVSAFIVQSPLMRALLCDRYPKILAERVHVIPSPMPPLPDALRHPPGSPSSTHTAHTAHTAGARIACVSGPGPHKNLSILPHILRALPPDVSIDLTLSPAQAPEVVALAARLGVSHRLRFLGHLPHADALRLMRDADACLLPSLLESFSYPLHEALSLGCPIIAPDLPYARDAASDAALFAPHASPTAFALAITHALSPPTALALRQRALTRASHLLLSPPDAAARYWSLLCTLTNPP